MRLDWETASEINNQYFQVERSPDLINIQPIGLPVAARGSANQGSHYLQWDSQPLPETSFYRVKTIDNNGELSYSEWKEVYFEDLGNIFLTVYPNPVQQHLTANIQSTTLSRLSIKLVDLQGRLLWSKQLGITPGETSILINMEQYAEGLYFIEMYAENGIRKTVRVLKRN